jgi:hypothetical protein
MEMYGKCLCGEVRFVARGVNPAAHCCHCNMCRTWSGGPTLGVSVASVEFENEASITRYQSSDWAERGFCHVCGTHLFYRLKETDQYEIWSGTFADTAGLEMGNEIFVDEKPVFYALAGDHPRLTAAEFMASVGMSSGA